MSKVLGRDDETLRKDGMHKASKQLQKTVEHRQLQVLNDLGWTRPLHALWQKQDYDDESSRMAQHVFS